MSFQVQDCYNSCWPHMRPHAEDFPVNPLNQISAVAIVALGSLGIGIGAHFASKYKNLECIRVILYSTVALIVGLNMLYGPTPYQKEWCSRAGALMDACKTDPFLCVPLD